MNKIKEKSITVGLALMLLGVTMQPVAAWGPITHMAIASELNNVPPQVTLYPKFTRGGSEGPDMFYFLPGYQDYSVLAHTSRTADLPRKMLQLANTDQKKAAYAYGWFTHYASDPTGHSEYVNRVSDPSDPLGHAKVEAGVDANVVNKVPDLTFSVPYGLVQTAYYNIYGKAPGLIPIFIASQAQAAALYIERDLIRAGAFDDLKNTYTWDGYDSFPGFRSAYDHSISCSNYSINYPGSLPNVDLNVDPSPCGVAASTSVSIALNKANQNQNKVDPEIRDTANELLRKGVIKVPVRDDKLNKVLEVGEPIIKDKKAFDDAIKELVKKKKGKK